MWTIMMKHDNLKIVLGQCVYVENREKTLDHTRYREVDKFIAIQVEDESGAEDTERCILFTDIEHTDMETVTLAKDLVKSMVAGRLYPVTLARRNTYLLKVMHSDGRVRILRISAKQLARADHRAAGHPLSCTTKSVLTDLFD
jgi:hypothetical protein